MSKRMHQSLVNSEELRFLARSIIETRGGKGVTREDLDVVWNWVSGVRIDSVLVAQVLAGELDFDVVAGELVLGIKDDTGCEGTPV